MAGILASVLVLTPEPGEAPPIGAPALRHDSRDANRHPGFFMWFGSTSLPRGRQPSVVSRPGSTSST